MPVKKFCIITESSSRSAWTAVIKWEVIITGGDGLCGCFGKKVLNHHIFIVSYLPLWQESTCMQHCVQLGMELQQWQGTCTERCKPWSLSNTAYISHSAISTLMMAIGSLTDTLQCKTVIGWITLHDILKYLPVEKVCTHLGHQDLIQLQKQTGVDICHRLLAPHNQDLKGFSTRLVTGDKPLLHYHTPNKRRLSVQLRHPGSPWREKFQITPSAEKQMVTILWDKTCEAL